MKRVLLLAFAGVLTVLGGAAWADGSSPSFQIAVVPEPSAIAGLAAGIAALGIGRFLKK